MANALLVVMVLITLQYFAEIQAKIHLFYDNAFEALFKRHDITKPGGFRRKRHVNLEMDDYKRLFSYFCARTYLNETFKFSSEEVIDNLSKSIDAAQIAVSKQDMLTDLVKSTCMLSREGLDYVFTHRSFQEYFAAFFISYVKPTHFMKIAPRLAARGKSDNVLPMISEMNKEVFEEEWALPQLGRMFDAMVDLNPLENTVDILRRLGEGSPIVFIGLEHKSSKGQRFSWGFELHARGAKISALDCTLMQARACLNKIYNWKGQEVFADVIRDSFAIEKFARQKADNGFIQFEIQEEDNRWLTKTSLASQLNGEKNQVRKLLSEIRSRVVARRSKLGSIID